MTNSNTTLKAAGLIALVVIALGFAWATRWQIITPPEGRRNAWFRQHRWTSTVELCDILECVSLDDD